jgi:hypothetical protein
MSTALKYVQRQAHYHYFRHPAIKRVRLDGVVRVRRNISRTTKV